MWVAGNWVKGSKKSYTVWVPNGARKGKKLTIRISTALGKGYGNGPEVKKVIKVKYKEVGTIDETYLFPASMKL